MHPSGATGATSGLIEGVNSAETVIKHFRNTLLYIQSRKDGLGLHSEDGTQEGQTQLFKDVDVAGPLLKLAA